MNKLLIAPHSTASPSRGFGTMDKSKVKRRGRADATSDVSTITV